MVTDRFRLVNSLHQAQYDFRAALCDSFNTPDAISVLTSLVGSSNAYLSTRPRPKNIDPLRIVAEWLTRMLRMLGLGEGTAVNQEGAIGWGEVSADSDSAVDVSYLVLVCYVMSTELKNVAAGCNSHAIPPSTLDFP